MSERLVLCGESTRKMSANESTLRLALDGNNKNITLKLEDVSKTLITDIPDLLTDLLELATYVYCADQATSRGGRTMEAGGAAWRRRFHFVLPVRDPDHWSQPAVGDALRSALSFVSDDEYRFDFERITQPAPLQGYLQFGDGSPAGSKADEVVLFSGGLDSLGGAVEELVQHDKQVTLVSHRSSPKVFEHQKRLVSELKRRFRQRVLHVPVMITKQGLRSRDYTQRSRSFLFAALALVVACLLGNSRIRFFENGVVSLNFPIAEQVVGSRATRTTHPLFISKIRELFSELVEIPVEVDNPFVWRTKGEIIQSIVGNDCGDLVRDTISCTRVYEMTRLHTHCGSCSQCIDRRFGVLSAGAEQFDPEEMYGLHLLTDERCKPEHRTMAESYVRFATDIRRMNELAFFSRFAGETSRVVDCFPGLNPDEVGRRILDLHQRHSDAVGRVLEAAVTAHRTALVNHTLPATSLLVMSVSQGTVTYAPDDGRQQGPFEEWIVQTESAEGGPAEKAAAHELLQIAINAATGLVVVRDLVQLDAADSKLIRELRVLYDEDLLARRIPENYRYIHPKTLAKQLGGSEPTLRRRIVRCRSVVGMAYRENIGRALPEDALIQNKPWKGYRLNPSVRFVSFDEIQKHYSKSQVDAADVTTSPKRY